MFVVYFVGECEFYLLLFCVDFYVLILCLEIEFFVVEVLD